MSQNPTQKTHEPELEATIVLGNGKTCARCQAKNASGGQCKQPSRTGFSTCWKHGAGSRVRELRGEKKKSGSPPKPKLLDESEIHAIQQRRLENREELDNTDEALAALQALLEFLVSRGSSVSEKFVLLEPIITLLEAGAKAFVEEAKNNPDETGRPDYDLMNEAREVGKAVGTASKLLSALQMFLDHVGVAATRVTQAAKVRAETRLKLAEARQMDMLVEWVAVVRACILDAGLEDTQRDFINNEMKRRLFGELGGVLPEPKTVDV